MFNPFVKFELRFIPAFIEQKKRYLVSQTFTRGKDLFEVDSKTYLMLTHYNDLGRAKIHYNAIAGSSNQAQVVVDNNGKLMNSKGSENNKKDKYAAILDLEKEEHKTKLEEMLSPDSNYIIYSSLIPDPESVKHAMDTIFKEKIKKYVDRKTNWHIPRDFTLVPRPELTFGELYVVMKFANQTARVKLEDLEKM